MNLAGQHQETAFKTPYVSWVQEIVHKFLIFWWERTSGFLYWGTHLVCLKSNKVTFAQKDVIFCNSNSNLLSTYVNPKY